MATPRRKRFTIYGQAGYTPPGRLNIALTPARVEYPFEKDLNLPFIVYIRELRDLALPYEVFRRLQTDVVLRYAMNVTRILTDLSLGHRVYRKLDRTLRLPTRLYRRLEGNLDLDTEVVGSRESPSQQYGG